MSPHQGCQSALSLNFSLSSITGGLPAICFLYDQTEYNYKKYWQETNLGCPYNYCKIHPLYAFNAQSQHENMFQSPSPGTYSLIINDPWDPRWAQGVKGGLYASTSSSYPTATIQVKRIYVQQVQLPKGVQTLQNLTSAIKSHEQKNTEAVKAPKPP